MSTCLERSAPHLAESRRAQGTKLLCPDKVILILLFIVEARTLRYAVALNMTLLPLTPPRTPAHSPPPPPPGARAPRERDISAPRTPPPRARHPAR